MTRPRMLNLLIVGLTAVFIGYLTVWLPGPAAGLSFLGIELGEWVKFMGVGPVRNLFYLPPITLALMLVALTLPWPNGRWQTWAMRTLALLVSLLAFPALEDMTGPFRQEYLPRIQWIGWVAGAVGVTAVLNRMVNIHTRTGLCWLLLAVLGVMGAVQPTRLYLLIQPTISQLFGVPVGFGWGIILNGAGHLLITMISIWQLGQMARVKKPRVVRS